MSYDENATDRNAPFPVPTNEEVKAARTLLMQCSPELTAPYNDRKRPRVVTVDQLNDIKRMVRHSR